MRKKQQSQFFWIAKRKRDLSLFGGEVELTKKGTEDETQMERSGQNLMINSPTFFYVGVWDLYEFI